MFKFHIIHFWFLGFLVFFHILHKIELGQVITLTVEN